MRPLVKSPTEFSKCGPATSKLQAPVRVFLCQEPKSRLGGTSALQYIRHGESTGVSRRNLQAAGGRWYDLGEQPVADVILPIAFNDRFFVVLNDAKFEVHQRFATIVLDDEHKHLSRALAVLLHSSVFALAAEILGRRGLGRECWTSRQTTGGRLSSLTSQSYRSENWHDWWSYGPSWRYRLRCTWLMRCKMTCAGGWIAWFSQILLTGRRIACHGFTGLASPCSTASRLAKAVSI